MEVGHHVLLRLEQMLEVPLGQQPEVPSSAEHESFAQERGGVHGQFDQLVTPLRDDFARLVCPELGQPAVGATGWEH